MRRSEAKKAFSEFKRLQALVNSKSLTPPETAQARVDLWEQVQLLRDQVEIFRKTGQELLSPEEQAELDAVRRTEVLNTPLTRSRTNSRSSSRSREPSVSSFEVVDIPTIQINNLQILPVGMSAPSTSAAATEVISPADVIRKRWKLEQEMDEFELECRAEARRKREELLDKAVADGMDLSALNFLSSPSPSPDSSIGGAAASEELTKLLGSQRIRGNVRDSEKFATGTEAYAKF